MRTPPNSRASPGRAWLVAGAPGLRAGGTAAPGNRALRRAERAAVAQPARGQRRPHRGRAGAAAGTGAPGDGAGGAEARPPPPRTPSARCTDTAAAVLGVLLLVSLLLAVSISLPVRRLTAATRLLASGNRKARAPRGGSAEIDRAGRILQHHGGSHRARGSGAARPPGGARASRRRAHPAAASPGAPRSRSRSCPTAASWRRTWRAR